MPDTHTPSLQIDIVSDVVCPWCIVGFRQLAQAMERTGTTAAVYWHPFELNPNMPPEGQNLRDHIIEKYGLTPEQSDTARRDLVSVGATLGITFNYSDDMRMVNTFKAHQLLDWAADLGQQTNLKQALFGLYFTENEDVSQNDVLLRAAEMVGLPRQDAAAVLTDGSRAEAVRTKQQFWTSRGISGVPSMIFAQKYLVTGAQGVDTYSQILKQCVAEIA